MNRRLLLGRRDSWRKLGSLLLTRKRVSELLEGQFVARGVLDLGRAGDLCLLDGDGGGEEAAAAVVDVLLVRRESRAALAGVGAQFATEINLKKCCSVHINLNLANQKVFSFNKLQFTIIFITPYSIKARFYS